MFPPPLLSSRPPALQILLAVGGPALLGLICGVLLSVSGGVYTVVTLLAILGGIGAGYEHADVLEGAGRGVTGGMLFGTFILLGHAIAGGRAKTALPSPHVVLVVATTIFGLILGAIGGGLRSRRERRATAPTVP